MYRTIVMLCLLAALAACGQNRVNGTYPNDRDIMMLGGGGGGGGM